MTDDEKRAKITLEHDSSCFEVEVLRNAHKLREMELKNAESSYNAALRRHKISESALKEAEKKNELNYHRYMRATAPTFPTFD
jgi:hypothetical protein